jgi:hypothetical protein
MVEDLDQASYRLAWLSVRDASDAIKQPALERGYEVTESCVKAILDELTIEDSEVQPGPLQIVCQEMWQRRPTDGPSPRLITETVFDGGISHVWQRFFDTIFRTGAFDSRLALDLLAPLITSRGTRNIVERTRLVSVRFWHPDRLVELLTYLERNRVLRKERKQDTEFFEITHEFLLEPALRALEMDLDYRRIDRAFNALASVGYEGRGEFELDRDDFGVLNDAKTRDLLEWKPWMHEVMLRSAIVHGMDRDTLRHWSLGYAKSAVPISTLLEADGPEGRRLLTIGELRQLGADRTAMPLSPPQSTRVFESLIASGQPMPGTLLQQTLERLHADTTS